MDRRNFFRSVVAGLGTAALPLPGWADAGAPDFVTAGNKPDNSTWLVGLTATGDVRFQIPIPGRGHAAALHPTGPQAVAFARRPGRFAVIIDCAEGTEVARLNSLDGRHFYGHGAFSSDGSLLFTTENDFDAPAGVLGIWDTTDGYKRIGEVPSGGIGPHEILALPTGGFVVANGGIQTHPDMGRAKLNLPQMRTNLTYLDAAGKITAQAELAGELHQNSIRHIALDQDGDVVAALQWQGLPTKNVPLVLRHTRGEDLKLLTHPDERQLKHYAGSIATCAETGEIAVTGPKGSHVLFFNKDGTPNGSSQHGTAAGVAQSRTGGLMITRDGGLVLRMNGTETLIPVGGDWAWDNHLVPISV
ncbi:hypothetical protein SAMN04488030_2040 [Aliiroseovarius halocynthiae]|uniref:DUF1513 domain-containing protein n=1 Tax=Aliiroseovarius halocynthiae TaxID=985055 RepID=A0A545SRE3_9RHOB|nr:DUF1513 domain-containing protein [Aliiroseovarius halocynthiae]TQV67555.1 DUF1513 domain-containing protein [Aliiroseovarius halocynthiae]SMR81570.1 hypothetical protein SAMN04488030_2040 [Aliiroseovarius halocynthiae]